MSFLLQPWHILFTALCAMVNERQQQTIEFQNAQIKALLKKLAKKRILPTDDQRRMLAVKRKSIGRKALRELTTIVTPDTILRWHRELIAKKCDHSQKRKSVGRRRIRQVIVDLVVRFARENPPWRYDRIQGALANVGYRRKRSGSMRAVRGPRRNTVSGIVISSRAITPGTTRTPKIRHIRLALCSRIRGVCTTCTGMLGSGIRTGW